MRKEILRERVLALFRLARTDKRYTELSQTYSELEKTMGTITQTLPEEVQDVLWAFICTSDELNWRMLEIIVERFALAVEDVQEI